MYVIIDLTTYSRVRNLSFAPQTDVTGSAVPINEFSLEIVTTDDIGFGQYAELYDDRDNLWAKYWIYYAEHITDNIVQIKARSDIWLLDGVTLDAVLYSGEAISNVLDDLMVRQTGAPGLVAPVDYTLDSSLSGITISGFCPQQTARARLQWVCFVAGAYIKTFFNDEIEILPIDATSALVPLDRTYWRPTVTYKDHVTAVKVIAYTFTQGTPQTTDKWVTDGTNYYIITEQEYTLANSAAPSSAPDNVVTVSGVYLVNSNNVSGILSHIAPLYFKRTEVQLDVVDNADYIPGDKLTVYADEDTLFTGYAKDLSFSFGVQAKASMLLTAAESVTGAKLVILYMWDDMQIGRAEYTFPVGYSYTIQNLFIDWTMNGHQYVFRPTTATVTGTMTSAGATETVNYAVALDLFEGVLHVISVDSVTVDSSGDYVIGVIA